MNNIKILTLFPESFDFFKSYGVIGKAIKKKLLSINAINIRDFSKNKHKKVDDTVYGGNAGMIIQCQPLYDALNTIKSKNSRVIYVSSTGSKFTQKKAIELATYKELIFICGHYEGIDARITNNFVDEEISIGDYILTGGEIPTMVIINSLSRFIEGVVGKYESLITDSYYNGLLQYDEYTKPRIFNGLEVPDVLCSGNHKKIAEWNYNNSLEKTKKIRKDLYIKYKRRNK